LDIRGEIVRVARLEPATVTSMFGLLGNYFEELDRRRFESDLAEKDDVILIRAGPELIGFSTVKAYEEQIDGQPVQVLFSGDTIVDARYWDTHELQRCFTVRALRAMRESALPLYWLLICGGYRTYRYLPVFFNEFWPRYDRPTPRNAQLVIDALARRRFGEHYRDGVVVDANGYLGEAVSPIGARQLRNPHVAFFDRVNPGHARGNELVCLTRFHKDNMTRAALRVLRGLTSN